GAAPATRIVKILDIPRVVTYSNRRECSGWGGTRRHARFLRPARPESNTTTYRAAGVCRPLTRTGAKSPRVPFGRNPAHIQFRPPAAAPARPGDATDVYRNFNHGQL